MSWATEAYLNGSLYSVLAIAEFKKIAKDQGLEALLSSFMKADQKDTENYGVSTNLKSFNSKSNISKINNNWNFQWVLNRARVKVLITDCSSNKLIIEF